MKVLQAIQGWTQKGYRSALVILTQTQGSVPAPPGAMLAVNEEGQQVGTVGGGALEHQLVQEALEGLDQGQAFESEHSLGDQGQLGMVCGGWARAFVRYFQPALDLIIFGGGHIAQALTPLAQHLGFQVTIIDKRRELQSLEVFQGVRFIEAGPRAGLDQVKTSKDTSYLVICTPGHQGDQEALEASLGRDFRYLGMIGSRRKVATIKDRLGAKGLGPADFKKIHMPIGLAIDDGSVEEIALAILAEIIMVKNKGQATSLQAF